MEAKVFNIAHCSLHDGDGIRTVVYVKGCNLRCPWCHNPEGISPKPQVLYREGRCIRCGRCVARCPEHHRIEGDRMVYVRSDCALCLHAAADCPNDALSVCGRAMTVDEVLLEVLKDKPYYDASGGGVTLSGGECLLYPDFLVALLSRCREAGVHTAVESAFHVPWDSIERVRPLTDTFLVDIKHADSQEHRRLTGVPNDRILNNLRRLSLCHPNIAIRIPLIPGANDGDENLLATAELVRSFGEGIRKVELLRYNNMAASKYAALGADAKPATGQPQDDDTMRRKCELMQRAVGNRIPIVYD